MSRAFLALLQRDLRLAIRAGGGAGLGVVFFLAVVVVTPFAIGPDLALLARIGPAILWIGALLASLIGLDRLFAADAEDGSLDVMSMLELPLELIAAAKGLAHWIATGLPLVIAAPVLSLLLNLQPASIGALTLTLLVGTPAITFLGLIGAAFAAAFRRGGLLGGGAGDAADHPRADLRRGGDRHGARRHRALRHAVPHPRRAVARRHGARPGRGGGGAAGDPRLSFPGMPEARRAGATRPRRGARDAI